MTQKPRVALLGCGRAARYLHLPVLSRLPSVELTALGEQDDVQRAEAARAFPGVTVWSDYHELLEKAEVDAVVIALPNHLHVPTALAAFERGLHVYVEKPLGLTPGEGAEVVDAWKQSGRIGMVGYNYRFGPMHIEARRLIAEGRIGTVVAIQSVFASASGELPEWKRNRKTGGGALLDLASHHLDLAGWFLDARPVSIGCSSSSSRTEDDTASVQLKFESGTVAQITASIAAVENDRFEITGDRGRIVIDRYRSDRIELHPVGLDRVRLIRAGYAIRDLVSPSYWKAKFTDAGPEASYWRALEAFALAIIENRQASPDLEVGLRSLELIEAAERSAREKRIITL